MGLGKRRYLYLASEAGSYGTDPDTDGSDYLWLPCLQTGTYTCKKNPLATQYFTGRVFKTKSVPGPDGWELSGIRIPLWGLSDAAGDGDSVPADDVLDIILTHLLGTQTQTTGEGVASSTSSTITMDSDPYSVNQLIAVQQGSIASGRTQWAQITVDNADNSYDVAPNWEANPEATAISYGSNLYTYTDGGGNSLAFCMVDDDIGTYSLLGGRIYTASIVAEYGQPIYLDFSVRGDSVVTTGKGSLTAVTTTAPANTPLQAQLSPVFWDGTDTETRKIQVDFGLAAAEHNCTSGANGRSNDRYVNFAPRVSIEPFQTDALRVDKRGVDENRFLCQFGGGVAASGVLNTMGLAMANATIVSNADTDDQGYTRGTVGIEPHDDGSGTALNFFQLARA